MDALLRIGSSAWPSRAAINEAMYSLFVYVVGEIYVAHDQEVHRIILRPAADPLLRLSHFHGASNAPVHRNELKSIRKDV